MAMFVFRPADDSELFPMVGERWVHRDGSIRTVIAVIYRFGRGTYQVRWRDRDSMFTDKANMQSWVCWAVDAVREEPWI